MRKVYTFVHVGSIPGIPGEFSAGDVVIVDEDTATGIATVVEVPHVEKTTPLRRAEQRVRVLTVRPSLHEE